MRVIAGLYKGRRLKTLDGLAIRPTSDRLRETLFNILAPQIEDASFLDICAGSGAVGIEALSRGARQVTFIESSRRAAGLIEANLIHCGIEDRVSVVNRDALTALKYFAGRDRRFDLCYFDPPYAADIYSPVMWLLSRHNLIEPGGVVAVEHSKRLEVNQPFGRLTPFREIRQGETQVMLYRMEPKEPMEPETAGVPPA
jgi:16S rRNA (guanine966-N2)-methyltransferase